MGKKGISIYPEHASFAENKAYIEKAAGYGYERIFTCFLSAEGSKAEILETFGALIQVAHEYQMEVFVDLAPAIFEKLHLARNDLSFFAELGADGIRLDETGDARIDAELTHNDFNIKIEFNASVVDRHVENVLSLGGNQALMTMCHNFYPQRYTGLGFELFEAESKRLKQLNFPMAAFISSRMPETFGPWPIDDGLCTLEMHRTLPFDLQARHLMALDYVDDIIIGNAFASDEELAFLGSLKAGTVLLKLDLDPEITELEKEIALSFDHVVRGDMSDYMARSTMPRIQYRDATIPERNATDLVRGDVVVLNDGYKRYKGELHIVLKDMPNDGRKNKIGHLAEFEELMLPYLEPWKPFKLMI